MCCKVLIFRLDADILWALDDRYYGFVLVESAIVRKILPLLGWILA